jgi:hypothetical protein
MNSPDNLSILVPFENKLSPEILYAIEQEVINYELAELMINDKEVHNGNTNKNN